MQPPRRALAPAISVPSSHHTAVTRVGVIRQRGFLEAHDSLITGRVPWLVIAMATIGSPPRRRFRISAAGLEIGD